MIPALSSIKMFRLRSDLPCSLPAGLLAGQASP